MKEIWGMWDNFGIFYPLLSPPGDKNDPPGRFFPPVTFFGGGWDSIPPASHPVRMGALTLPPSLPNMPSNELWKPPRILQSMAPPQEEGRGRKEGQSFGCLLAPPFKRKREPAVTPYWVEESGIDTLLPPPPLTPAEKRRRMKVSHFPTHCLFLLAVQRGESNDIIAPPPPQIAFEPQNVGEDCLCKSRYFVFGY